MTVPSLTFEEISSAAPSESSARVRERVGAAREFQMARQVCANAQIEPARIRSSLRLTRSARGLLELAVDRFGLSARAHDRALRVALTLRDLGDVASSTASSWPVEIDESQIGEALSYRQADPQACHVVTVSGGHGPRSA